MCFRELKEVLADADWPGERTRPSWDDLSPERLHPDDRSLVGNVLQWLGRGSVVLHGTSNHGKTFLALAVARSFMGKSPSKTVMSFYGDNVDLDDATEAVAMVRTHANALNSMNDADRAQHKYLFVVDQANSLDPRTLGRLLRSSHTPGVRILLVCESRLAPDKSVEDDWPPPKRCIGRRPATGVFNSIVRRFLKAYPGAPQLSQQDLTRFRKRVGFDLDRAVHCVAAWAEEGFRSRLDDVDDRFVIEFTARDYDLDMSSHPGVAGRPARARLLYRIAQLAEIGLVTHTSDLPDDELREVSLLGGRLRQRCISRSVEPGVGGSITVALADEKAPRWLIPALERYRFTRLPTLLECLGRRSEDPRLVWGTMTRLAKLRKGELVSDLLKRSEVQEALHISSESRTVESILRLGKSLRTSLPAETRTLVHQHFIYGSHVQARGSLAGAKANRLILAMRNMRPRDIFEEWEEADWDETVGTSGLNALRLLVHNLNERGASTPCKHLGFALGRVDLNSLPPSPSARLQRDVNGLLGNLAVHAVETLPAIISRLTYFSDLSRLISAADPYDAVYLAETAVYHNHAAAGELFERNLDAFREHVLSDRFADALSLLLAIHKAAPNLTDLSFLKQFPDKGAIPNS